MVMWTAKGLSTASKCHCIGLKLERNLIILIIKCILHQAFEYLRLKFNISNCSNYCYWIFFDTSDFFKQYIPNMKSLSGLDFIKAEKVEKVASRQINLLRYFDQNFFDKNLRPNCNLNLAHFQARTMRHFSRFLKANGYFCGFFLMWSFSSFD